MKKIVFIYFLLHIIFLPVFAQEYDVLEYIPVDRLATVHTDKFNYNDFTFSSSVDEKGNHLLKFDSIHNNKKSRTAVSINLLIFDRNHKNIGFLSYCSDKDMKSDYSGFKLLGEKEEPFQIIIDSNYFVSGKNMMDAEYVAVLDENKYCRIENNNKYEGLTIEEITNGDKESSNFTFISDLFTDVTLLITILIVILVLIILAGLGFLFNILHKRMYGTTTFLSYIPVVNFFISMQLAFGKIVAAIYIAFLGVSVVVYFLQIKILLYIFLGLFVLSVIVVIIKILTGKYDLFYLEPSMDSSDSVFRNDSSSEDDRALSLDYHELTSSDKQVTLQETMERNDSNDGFMPDLDKEEEEDKDDFSGFMGF